MSEHSYDTQEEIMKIAYIVDGSTELTPSQNKLENVNVIPFRGYIDNGKLEVISTKAIKAYQKLDTKQYIEPTPGSYRDLYKKLRKDGYDYIVVIPQTKDKSISYKNAEYASRFVDNVVVIDSSKYEISITEILNNLINDKSIKDNTILIGLDQLLDLIKGILVKLIPVKN